MWFILKKTPKSAIFGLLAVTVAQLLEGVFLLVLRALTDSASDAVANSFDAQSLNALWIWIIIFPLLYFIIENVWRLSGICGMQIVTRGETNVATVLFKYLIQHSRAYFNTKFAGSLVNKITNASRGVGEMFASVLWHFYPLFIGLIINIVIVLTIDVFLGLMFGGWILLFFGINYFLVKKKQPFSFAVAKAGSTVRGKMVDAVSNIATIHATASHEYERKFVGRFIESYRKKHIKSWIASEWILFINGILLAIFVFGMISLTVFIMKNNQASLGSLVLIISMTIQLTQALFFLGQKMTQVVDNYSQIDEGLEELIIPYDVVDKADAKSINETKGHIVFKNVSFNFGNDMLFDNFSLDIKTGEKIGIVGVSGAGKTTLTNLLLRNHDVQDGIISIDGYDIRDITRESFRKKIAFVPQDAPLFHRTIIDNIRYGSMEVSEDEVIESAKKAQAHDFILSFPDGYYTYVGERGVKLSGGQRQRIVIARAFLKSAPILILDEATSSLDSESEGLVQFALSELMKEKTVIAIAHRLSTLNIMDRIVVLSEGKIVEDGTHKELLAKGGIYTGLWNKQVEGFIE